VEALIKKLPLHRDVTNRSAKLAKFANAVSGLPYWDGQGELASQLLSLSEAIETRYSFAKSGRDDPRQLLREASCEQWMEEIINLAPDCAKQLLTNVITTLVALPKFDSEMVQDIMASLKLNWNFGIRHY